MEAENYKIRELLPVEHEIAFLTVTTYIAYYPTRYPIPDAATAKHIPHISLWTDNWGREGDTALVAQCEDQLLGAACYRIFSAESQMPGYLDERTPILLIAVLPQYRRMGIARRLLTTLIQHAKEASFPALSLAVSMHNPAIFLYEQTGFRSVQISDELLVTMHKSLATWDTISSSHVHYYAHH